MRAMTLTSALVGLLALTGPASAQELRDLATNPGEYAGEVVAVPASLSDSMTAFKKTDSLDMVLDGFLLRARDGDTSLDAVTLQAGKMHLFIAQAAGKKLKKHFEESGKGSEEFFLSVAVRERKIGGTKYFIGEVVNVQTKDRKKSIVP